MYHDDTPPVTPSPHHQKRLIIRSFKSRGLTLQSSALDGLLNILRREASPIKFRQILNAVIDEIKERIHKEGRYESLVVSSRFLQEVVADMTRDGEDVMKEALQLLDAWCTPRLVYDGMKRRFELVKGERKGCFGGPKDKVDMILQRYALIHQRMLRQDMFRPNAVTASSFIHPSGGEEGGCIKITPIEELLGRSGVKILLGMVTQIEEGQYHLEDPTATIPLSLTSTLALTDGFLTEQSILLVEGELIDGILHAHKVGHPIFEPRRNALDAVGLRDTDIFGAVPTLSELAKLRQQEEEHGAEGTFVLLSDVHLDDAAVMERLERLFAGFAAEDWEEEIDGPRPPLPVFVLLGNFTSGDRTCSKAETVRCFDELGDLVAKFPRLAEEGRFVLVPGVEDVGLGCVVPRPPLPEYVTGGLRSRAKHMHFGSNPCRLRYFSREIVVGRMDVLNRFRRNCVLKPEMGSIGNGNDGKDDAVDASIDEDSEEDIVPKTKKPSPTQRLIQHAVKTMLDQGHLCPVPLSECPIYWQHDHALRLYPAPDTIVLGDGGTERYSENYGDCDVMNPGSFYRDFGFLVYRPFGGEGGRGDGEVRSEIEFSAIDG